MPLNVWFYRSGFCRFSSQRYDNSDLTNEAVHLTNVAIQKKQDTYDSVSGGKWDVRHLKLYLMSRYGIGIVDKLFYEIQMIVVRSLHSVQQVMINDKHCFELYGFDIMFDETFKPWLIEVNASPSLTANTPEDRQLKVKMLTSVLDIVDIEGVMKGDEIRVGGFDLIIEAGQLREPSSSSIYTSMLGASIPSDAIERKPRDPTPSAPAQGQAKGGSGKRGGRASTNTDESKSGDRRTGSRGPAGQSNTRGNRSGSSPGPNARGKAGVPPRRFI
mmetsp:Transcript_32159/g.41204  ORF Transcript_32159/g.41204 Transcript_32159/m.41204 type:complete len:273 (+) Transcript_32159:3-821(+)